MVSRLRGNERTLGPVAFTNRTFYTTRMTVGVPTEIEGRWTRELVLKRDLFSTVERGRFRTSGGEAPAVVRRIDEVPWWAWPLARMLFARERRALVIAGELGVTPPLLYAGRQVLVRGWIDGTVMHIAKPYGDRAFFQSAKAALRKLHRAGICHNDLSKQQNWLRGSDGRAYLTDFQLASSFSRRSRLFRLLAYEDLRHLLKHKHRYLLEEMTPAEWKMRGRKTPLSSWWLLTGKKIYHLATRGILGFVDQEGGGTRLAHDGPRIAECLKQHPGVHDAAVVLFYDRGGKHSLYAFVEGTGALSERQLRDGLARNLREVPPPEQIQISAALPRDQGGAIRTEMLQLIASNQLDQVEQLTRDKEERSIVARVVAERRNFADKF
jgi:predicted Ser/Thr protein kinase